MHLDCGDKIQRICSARKQKPFHLKNQSFSLPKRRIQLNLLKKKLIKVHKEYKTYLKHNATNVIDTLCNLVGSSTKCNRSFR